MYEKKGTRLNAAGKTKRAGSVGGREGWRKELRREKREKTGEERGKRDAAVAGEDVGYAEREFRWIWSARRAAGRGWKNDRWPN